MPIVPHSISIVYSLKQRLRSLRHRFGYQLSERLRWSRGVFHEEPALELPVLPIEAYSRITALRFHYQAHFERDATVATALNNYEYLEILDRAWTAWGAPVPQNSIVCDIGCASFWYAAAMQRFFRPSELIGVDVEGYRLFKDGRTRIDYARGYLTRLAGGRFIVADYCAMDLPADVICAWFPFVTPAAILAWRLPLSLLRPRQLFNQIYHNLAVGGLFVMVNHGAEEAAIAAALCAAAGLRKAFEQTTVGVLSAYRSEPPQVSIWRRQAGVEKSRV